MKPRKRRPIEDRFWEKVDKTTDGCWIWTASTKTHGYGQFWTGERLGLAHRFAYEYFVGPIPVGLHLDHLCRNIRCVNPEHLEPVTCRENLVRGETQIARQVAQTHCLRGHPFSGDNLIVLSNGRRACRACRKWYYERRAPRRAPRDGDDTVGPPQPDA